jgi:hypothetical protein
MSSTKILTGLLVLTTLLAGSLLHSQSTMAATVLGAYATVDVPQLNIRSEPNTQSAIVGTAVTGKTIPVIGRLADCSWLQVVQPPNNQGWVLAEYVTLSRPCQDLPSITVRTTAAQPAAKAATAPVATAAPAPTQVPAPTPAPVATCSGLPGESYGALTVDSAPTDRPAAQHPDLNLALRGFQPVGETSALQSFGPVFQVDHEAPQLRQLFGDQRHAGVNAVYQVRDWDWGCNCPGAYLDYPPVTLAELAVAPGEAIHTPDSPRTIGDGYEALVLHATSDQLTLKFTREDNVISGYTLHVAAICVDPGLVALYNRLNESGRGQLPALRGGQPFGRAQRGLIQVAIRDNGQFLDPRYLENWWR